MSEQYTLLRNSQAGPTLLSHSSGAIREGGLDTAGLLPVCWVRL